MRSRPSRRGEPPTSRRRAGSRARSCRTRAGRCWGTRPTDRGLTPRDKQILGHLAKGLTGQRSRTAWASPSDTVKHYLTQVFLAGCGFATASKYDPRGAEDRSRVGRPTAAFELGRAGRPQSARQLLANLQSPAHRVYYSLAARGFSPSSQLHAIRRSIGSSSALRFKDSSFLGRAWRKLVKFIRSGSRFHSAADHSRSACGRGGIHQPWSHHCALAEGRRFDGSFPSPTTWCWAMTERSRG